MGLIVKGFLIVKEALEALGEFPFKSSYSLRPNLSTPAASRSLGNVIFCKTFCAQTHSKLRSRSRRAKASKRSRNGITPNSNLTYVLKPTCRHAYSLSEKSV